MWINDESQAVLDDDCQWYYTPGGTLIMVRHGEDHCRNDCPSPMIDEPDVDHWERMS